MPSKNTVKNYKEDAYYHVYNRGIDNRQIFLDDEDYSFFLNLLKRHLTRNKEKNSRGVEYESFAGRVELLSFCLLPNNYHLLFYLNNDDSSITELMRRVSGTYSTYFNKKYNRVGPLFQGVYKALEVDDESYLLNLTRYIHRSTDDYYNWQYSSLPHFIRDKKEDWVVPDRVYRLYDWGTYEQLLNDHVSHHEITKKIYEDMPYVVQ
jgi:REP element-mobilizing transposase RayT